MTTSSLSLLNLGKVVAFQNKILAWYEQNRRDLPWRKSRDPYRILVSEMMLQQTQVVRVLPKYEAWLMSFPTVQALADASVAEVLRLWSGLGYNRRALNLQKAAKIIAHDYKGVWPTTVEGLKALPGIGEYTARAVACFAFNQQVAVVDTNVRKVILFEVTKRPHFAEASRGKQGDEVTKGIKEIQGIADQLLPVEKAYEWNQALMDYSSAILKREKITIPKQSPFVGSRRFYRGKIIKILLQKERVHIDDIVALVQDATFQEKGYSLDAILATLEKEGFILRSENEIMVRKK